jgi:hypothetical protein
MLYSLHSSSFLPQWRITPMVVHNFHTNFSSTVAYSLHSGLFPPQWLIPSTVAYSLHRTYSLPSEFFREMWIWHQAWSPRSQGPLEFQPPDSIHTDGRRFISWKLTFYLCFSLPFLFSFVHFFHSATYYGLDMSAALSQTCHFLTSFILTSAVFRFLMPSCCKKLKMTEFCKAVF